MGNGLAAILPPIRNGSGNLPDCRQLPPGKAKRIREENHRYYKNNNQPNDNPIAALVPAGCAVESSLKVCRFSFFVNQQTLCLLSFRKLELLCVELAAQVPDLRQRFAQLPLKLADVVKHFTGRHNALVNDTRAIIFRQCSGKVGNVRLVIFQPAAVHSAAKSALVGVVSQLAFTAPKSLLGFTGANPVAVIIHSPRL